MERETAFLSANTPLNMRAPAFLALLFRPETRCCCGKDRFLFRERPSRLGTPAKLPRDLYLRCHGGFQPCFRSSASFTSFSSSKTMLVDCSIKQTKRTQLKRIFFKFSFIPLEESFEVRTHNHSIKSLQDI